MSNCCCKPKLVLYSPGLRSGFHSTLRNDLYDSIKTAHELTSCQCVQLFLGSPTTNECRNISETDRKQCKKYCEENDLSLYIHCPYVANLAKPNTDYSMNILRKQLTTINDIPGSCVLHIGKVGTLETVAQHINELQSNNYLRLTTDHRNQYKLLLEVAAGQGTELGTNWEELRHLYEALDKTRVGLCIDTQHAFASGMNSFNTHEDIVKLWDEADAIATRGISMIHLNDSKVPFGNKIDRHEALRQGHIWYHSDQGLKALIKRSKEYGLDLVSETSDPIGDNLLIRQYQI
jgi:deoxyribonuclease-4